MNPEYRRWLAAAFVWVAPALIVVSGVVAQVASPPPPEPEPGPPGGTPGVQPPPPPAQVWAAKPLRYIVPYPPGSFTDVLARIVVDKLQTAVGQPVVVENRPGASGKVATEFVAKAPGDGYTLLQITATQSIGQVRYKVPYNVERDLAPVALIAHVPNVMVVSPAVPAATVQDFIRFAKSKPGQINFASSGFDTSNGMAAELFRLQTGINIARVTYKANAPAVAALIGGEVTMMFNDLPSSIPHIRAGKLRALAITTAKRHPALPQVPTMQEAGVAGHDVSGWIGIVAPRGVPANVVERINADVNKILALSDVRELLTQRGVIPTPGTPEQFSVFLKGESAKWARIVKAAGIKVE